jgi:hypothetical protein
MRLEMQKGPAIKCIYLFVLILVEVDFEWCAAARCAANLLVCASPSEQLLHMVLHAKELQ